jgi:potassium-transporting ATPase KdpC subunit
MLRLLRPQLAPAFMLTLAMALLVGIAYPVVVWGIGQGTMKYRANGSFFSRNGQVVGSPLIGQNFNGADGNPDPKYFQPRPSNAGKGYDPTASAASNLGPGDPRLVGFQPGFNTVDLKGNPSNTNPFATPDDPFCVPMDPDGVPVTSPSDGQKYAMKDGAYVCDTNTVPERAASYRQLNGLAANAIVPVDAVTGSDSGLDPDISIANAELQAARVAQARGIPAERVLSLVHAHINSLTWGFLGEKTINVLDLNLALDGVKG